MGRRGRPEPCYIINAQGPRPIREGVSREAADESPVSGDLPGGLGACDAAPCGLQVWHYVYGTLLGRGAPAHVGILFEQRYEGHVTWFFHHEFATECSALPDA